jgi:divalent metal cation (Fe/Co/Zn/Cd) transporter
VKYDLCAGGSILGVNFLDPLAGLVVSTMIVNAGLKTGHQSILELVDAAIPAQQLEPIRQTILQVEGVKVQIVVYFTIRPC